MSARLAAARRVAPEGDLDQARGAALVAAVAAIRMALASAEPAVDHAFKAAFLCCVCESVGPVVRARLSHLVAVALARETDRRRLGGLGVEGDDTRSARARSPSRPVPFEAPGHARRCHLDASQLVGDLDCALHTAGLLLDDLVRHARRGTSADGTRRFLADIAIALCLDDRAAADDPDLRVGLLEVLRDALPAGDPVRDVIRAGTADERERWGRPVLGTA